MDKFEQLSDWEKLLSAERHLQHLLPNTVLVGGTAVALHAHHRESLDGDHVLDDLRGHFDEVLQTLETTSGWITDRINKPVLILGQLNGVLTGIRQLRRIMPLEVEVIEGLRIPTLKEMARIKLWLLVTRYTVRDYLDTVVLLERIGPEKIKDAIGNIDSMYPQLNGASVLAEGIQRLGEASPVDRNNVNLTTYRALRAPWNDWEYLQSRGRDWATCLSKILLDTET